MNTIVGLIHVNTGRYRYTCPAKVLQRPKVANYITHESFTVDTRDHEEGVRDNRRKTTNKSYLGPLGTTY